LRGTPRNDCDDGNGTVELHFLGENWQRSEQGYSSVRQMSISSSANLAFLERLDLFLAVFEAREAPISEKLHRLPGLLPGHDDMYLYAAVLDLIGTAASGSLLSSLVNTSTVSISTFGWTHMRVRSQLPAAVRTFASGNMVTAPQHGRRG